MSTFDIKKFLINEGMTRVSRDRKRLLKEETEYWTSDDYDDFVDSAVGTAAPGMESFGTAFVKNLVTSERIKVVDDGSTYTVYYAKAGEPFVEVTPDNIEKLNLTVDFSSPENWEEEEPFVDAEEYGIWVKVQDGQSLVSEENPLEDPNAEWFESDEEQDGVEQENIPDGLYITLDSDNIIDVSDECRNQVEYVTSGNMRKLYWIPVRKGNEQNLDEARKPTTTKKQGTVRQGDVKASPTTKVKKKTTGNGGRKFEEFDKKEFEKSPEGQPKVVKGK